MVGGVQVDRDSDLGDESPVASVLESGDTVRPRWRFRGCTPATGSQRGSRSTTHCACLVWGDLLGSGGVAEQCALSCWLPGQ